jgi:hypothetical protein
MKKGKLFPKHKYGQISTNGLWIPQALALSSRRETYRNKPIVLRKDPQFDQSALTDVRLRSLNRLYLV